MSDIRERRPHTPDQLISLLSVHASQFGSYTTLLWQVPALSLTAQSFLLTIALTNGNGKAAKLSAAVLSAIIAGASYALMHDQRGHAINHGELVRRLSEKLFLKEFLGGNFTVDDGVPGETNAEDVWTWYKQGQKKITLRAGLMYAVWKGCILIFLLVDIGIIGSVLVLPPEADHLGARVPIAVGIVVAIRIL